MQCSWCLNSDLSDFKDALDAPDKQPSLENSGVPTGGGGSSWISRQRRAQRSACGGSIRMDAGLDAGKPDL
jgi:hypothetical protein